MTRSEPESKQQISIKDGLKRTALAMTAIQKIPLAARIGALAFVFTAVMASAVNFAVKNVLMDQGFETIAFAKPAATERTLRPNQVATFGNKVRQAFGIRGEVATEFADWILEASERQSIKPELLASLVLTESSFRKHVKSHVGAIGPAQIRPDFWGSFCGDHELTDPEQNVYWGAQVLSYYIERCDGDLHCALGAYNIGLYGKRERAAKRYVAKIDRYVDSLENTSL